MGCAHKSATHTPIPEFTNCLSSNGRGRLTIDQNRHLFRYESRWMPEEGKWLMAMNLPVHGEERLDFHWQTSPLKGHFVGRIVSEWEAQMQGNQTRFQDAWPEFQRASALLMASLSSGLSSSSEVEVQWDSQQWKGKVLVSKELSLEWQITSGASQQWDRIKWLLAPRVSSPNSRPVLAMELFASECLIK